MQEQNKNLLDVFLAGGFVMWPLLLMGIAAIALVIMRFMAFNSLGAAPAGLTEEVTDLVRKGREGDALRRAEEAPGAVPAAMATVIRNRALPIEDIEREAEVTNEDYLMKLEHQLPWIDTFTTLSPLLGLLGTILGMVKVFQQFTSNANDDASKQRILAGVGESLYATAFGIMIALFCFFFYNYFAARQRSLGIAMQQASTRLIAALHERRSGATRAA